VRTIGVALAEARLRLGAAGIASSALDARLLLGRATGLDATALVAHGREAVDADADARFDADVARRAAREPMAHILGLREFWGLSFAASPAALVPRPETEGVVEAALSLARNLSGPDRLSICDLGVGSGAILIALLTELGEARGLALDISRDALDLARENALRHGVAERITFVHGDLAHPPPGPFDIIVSNPPYIPSADIAALDPEVRVHEPRLALDGGPDGCDAYRAIARHLPSLLAPNGGAALEIGAGQVGKVAAILTAAGLVVHEVLPDLTGTPRVVVARRSALA
jgi:release factor glutamine methyltransferase